MSEGGGAAPPLAPILLGMTMGRLVRQGAVQCTRAYETGLNFQRGLLAGVFHTQQDLTAYLFNLGWEYPAVVISAEVGF